MNADKARVPRNRLPSRKTTRRDRLVRLKESVNVTCDLFFAKRGIGNKGGLVSLLEPFLGHAQRVEQVNKRCADVHRHGPLRIMVVAVAAGDIRDDVVGFGFVVVVPNEYPACVVDQFAAVVTLKARTSVSVATIPRPFRVGRGRL
jgi:hypothetical protein